MSLGNARRNAQIAKFQTEASTIVNAITMDCLDGTWDGDENTANGQDFNDGITLTGQLDCSHNWTATIDSSNISGGCSTVLQTEGVQAWGCN